MAFDFNATTNKNYLQTINPNAPDAGTALKVLSLNLPGFLGGSPIAPDALLRPGLSVNAQVGGTAPAPAAPLSPPSAALTGLASQLGNPAPASDGPSGTPLAAASSPSSPTAQSPFATTSAPLAQLASNSINGPDPATNNFAPPTAPPAPSIQFRAPRPDSGSFAGTPLPDSLLQVLTNLLNGGGQTDSGFNDNGGGGSALI